MSGSLANTKSTTTLMKSAIFYFLRLKILRFTENKCKTPLCLADTSRLSVSEKLKDNNEKEETEAGTEKRSKNDSDKILLHQK